MSQTILLMFLLPSMLPLWTLNVVGLLLSTEGERALRFKKKYHNLYYEDKRRSCGFEQTEFKFFGELSLLHCY